MGEPHNGLSEFLNVDLNIHYCGLAKPHEADAGSLYLGSHCPSASLTHPSSPSLVPPDVSS